MKEKTKQQRQNYDFIFICLAFFLQGIAFYSLIPILPLYFKERLWLNESDIGLIMGAFAIGSLFVRPFAGQLLDRLNRKKVILVAISTLILINSCYFVFKSKEAFFYLRIFHGLSWGIISTGLFTLVSAIVPAQTRGKKFGIFGSMFVLAMSCATPVGLVVYEKMGLNLLITASILFILLSLWFILQLSAEESKVASSQPLDTKALARVLINPQVNAIAFVCFVTAFVASGIISFIVLYGREMDLSLVNYFFVLHSLSTVVARPIQGMFYDKLGYQRVFPVAIALGIGALALLGFLPSNSSILIAAVLLGLSFAVLNILPQAMVLDITPADRIGMTNATMSMHFDLGFVVGGYCYGMIGKLVGLKFSFQASFILMIFLMIYFLFFLKPRYRLWIKRA